MYILFRLLPIADGKVPLIAEGKPLSGFNLQSKHRCYTSWDVVPHQKLIGSSEIVPLSLHLRL